jgi:hypothetical protein
MSDYDFDVFIQESIDEVVDVEEDHTRGVGILESIDRYVDIEE